MTTALKGLTPKEKAELTLTPEEREQFFAHFAQQEAPAPRREVGEFKPIRRDPESIIRQARTRHDLLAGIDQSRPLPEQVVEILTRAGLDEHAYAVVGLIAERKAAHGLKHMDADEMLKVVASVFKVDLDDLRGPCRSEHLARARHTCWFIAVRLFGMSIQATSRWYGRDHSSISHGVKRVENLLDRQARRCRMTDCDHLWLNRTNTACRKVMTLKEVA